jgi:hypothetical protein
MTVTVTVHLTAVDRRRLSFRFEVHDEVEKVGEGTQERFVIDPSSAGQGGRPSWTPGASADPPRWPPPPSCGIPTGAAWRPSRCFGGGTGFAAACDVVIAADDAVFSISGTRWA